MFNLPFPTDSLYKFAFMFGLVLIVYSFYYNDGHLNKFDKNQTYHKLDSLNKKLETINDMIEANKDDNKVYSANKDDQKYFSADDAKGFVLIFKNGANYDTTDTKIKKGFRDILSYSDTSNQLFKEKINTIMQADTSKVKIKAQLISFLPKIASVKFKDSIKRILSSPAHADIKEQLTLFLFKLSKSSNNKIFNDVNTLYGDIQAKNNLIKADFEEKINESKGKASEYTLYFYGLLFTGIFLFICGTLGWYYKIQKPQDDLLKMQITELKQKVDDSKALPVKESAVIEIPEASSIKTRKHFEPQVLPRPQVRGKK
jgi:hypothetical protein